MLYENISFKTAERATVVQDVSSNKTYSVVHSATSDKLPHLQATVELFCVIRVMKQRGATTKAACVPQIPPFPQFAAINLFHCCHTAKPSVTHNNSKSNDSRVILVEPKDVLFPLLSSVWNITV